MTTNFFSTLHLLLLFLFPLLLPMSLTRYRSLSPSFAEISDVAGVPDIAGVPTLYIS
jgi:hypothetical protein